MNHATAAIGLLAAQLMAGGPVPKAATSNAPPPKLIREIDLNQIIPDSPRSLAFSFSPDEMWLSVAIGPRLTLLSLEGGQRTEIDPGIMIAGSPIWSPDSGSLLVQGFVGGTHPAIGIAKLFSVRGDELLRTNGRGLKAGVPPGGVFGFLDAGHLLAAGTSAKGIRASIDRLDLQGHVLDSWILPKGGTVAAVNADRGLLAVFSDHEDSKTLIAEYSSRKVIQTFPNHTWLEPDGYLGGAPWVYFADNGKAFCSLESNGKYNTSAQCRDVDSGEKINEFRRFQGGASAREFQSFQENDPPEASTHGSRVLLTHITPFHDKRGVDRQPVVYEERVVWDFRSGEEVAAWGMPQDVWRRETGGFADPLPVPIVMSATGHYVAESSSGVLRIYQIP